MNIKQRHLTVGASAALAQFWADARSEAAEDSELLAFCDEQLAAAQAAAQSQQQHLDEDRANEEAATFATAEAVTISTADVAKIEDVIAASAAG